MNCYYSNLIEGHETHPVDIERAFKNDYSQDAEKRNLQLEAKAYITVQQWIDGGGLKGRVTTIDGITGTHRRFGELLPEELLWVTDRTAAPYRCELTYEKVDTDCSANIVANDDVRGAMMRINRTF